MLESVNTAESVAFQTKDKGAWSPHPSDWGGPRGEPAAAGRGRRDPRPRRRALVVLLLPFLPPPPSPLRATRESCDRFFCACGLVSQR